MYKLIKGSQSTFEDALNGLPDCTIVDFCCSADASFFAALVKISKAAIEKEAKAEAAKVKADEEAKAKEIETKREAKKSELEAALKELDKGNEAEIVLEEE